MLVSRDEQSCLVVSYREVKACVESAFRSVLFPAPPPPFRLTSFGSYAMLMSSLCYSELTRG